MDDAVTFSVPPALRQIFAAWGEGCDPAPDRHGADPAALAAFYGRLASSAAEMHLARHALARIYHDAARNKEYGQFTELRQEGHAVFPWIAQLVAADPELARCLAGAGAAAT